MPKAPAMRARLRTEGFTLIELMVVVAIVAVVAAAAAPAIGAAVRDRKTSTAALDVVRTIRGARAAAAGYGRAYMVRFTAADDADQGSLIVVRGTTNRCSSSTFATGTSAEIAELAYRSPVSSGETDDWKIALTNDEGITTLDLCYEPTGVTHWRSDTTAAFQSTSYTVGEDGPAQSGFGFTVQRTTDEGNEGVARRVVVPLGGDARIAR